MLPLDPKSTTEATTAGLDLISKIIELITKSRKEGRPLNTPQVIGALIQGAQGASSDILNELRRIKQRLKDAKLLAMTPDQIETNVSFWRLRKYLAFREYNRKIEAVVNTLGDLQQDLVAMAHCRESEDLIVASYKEARDAGKARRALIESDATLETILNSLITDAEQLDARLRAL